MHGHGKSDRPIVPQKPANKGYDRTRLAERVEGRGLAKGNRYRLTRFRAQEPDGSGYGER